MSQLPGSWLGGDTCSKCLGITYHSCNIIHHRFKYESMKEKEYKIHNRLLGILIIYYDSKTNSKAKSQYKHNHNNKAIDYWSSITTMTIIKQLMIQGNWYESNENIWFVIKIAYKIWINWIIVNFLLRCGRAGNKTPSTEKGK